MSWWVERDCQTPAELAWVKEKSTEKNARYATGLARSEEAISDSNQITNMRMLLLRESNVSSTFGG